MKKNIENLQSKSLLAKLMANENIHVRHSPEAETASFDVIGRVLTLPILKQTNMNGFVYDGFIAHEVAHALWTPANCKDEMAKQNASKVPWVFMNIVEDARIEKLIQQKYPGSRADFTEMYKQFVRDDLFEVNGKNIQELGLIDRINLFFKAGRFLDVKFTDEENKFVRMTNDCVTFPDVVRTAKAIYEWMKQNNQNSSGKSDSGFGDGDEQGDPTDANGNPVWGKSQNSFEKNRKNLNSGEKDSCFGEGLSSQDVVDKVVHSDRVIKKFINKVTDGAKYKAHENKVKKTVNMMVNQFNMRKAAKDYQRTQTAKSGRLNMKNISEYRTSDDIFRRNEVVLAEKNHGFIFFLDWSGSMSGNISSTFEQFAIMMHFCRKLQIPFEVYGFTDGTGFAVDEEKRTDKIMSDTSGNVIFKLLDSSMKRQDYINLIGNYFENLKDPNKIYSMGNTPIYNTALTADIIVNKFRKKYNREKNIVVFLSDGGSTDNVTFNGKHYKHTYLFDKHKGRNYKIDTYHDIFKYVKEHNDVYKMLGFYLTSQVGEGIAKTICPENYSEQLSKVEKDFANKKYAYFENGTAFDKYFMIDMNEFSTKDIKLEEEKHNRMNKYTSQEELVESFAKLDSAKMKSMTFLRIMIDTIA